MPRARRARAPRCRRAVRGARGATGGGSEDPRPRAGRRRSPCLQSEGVPLFEADAVLARIIPSGSLEQIIYRVDALHWIEERGIPVINSPRAIERAVDKFYTSALLQEAGPAHGRDDRVRAGGRRDGRRARAGRRGDQAALRLDGQWPRARQRSRRRLPGGQGARDHARRLLRAARHRPRRPRLPSVRDRRPGAGAHRAPGRGRRLALERGARRRGACRSRRRPGGSSSRVRAAAAIGADYAGVDLLVDRDGRRLRARGQRHSRLGRAAARHGRGRRRGASWITRVGRVQTRARVASHPA